MITIYAKNGSTEIIEEACNVIAIGNLINLEDKDGNLVAVTSKRKIQYLLKINEKMVLK